MHANTKLELLGNALNTSFLYSWVLHIVQSISNFGGHNDPNIHSQANAPNEANLIHTSTIIPGSHSILTTGIVI